MNLYLYNTLTRQKKLFMPRNPACITMYVCGPTVYDSPHIGNARSIVIYDVLYRALNNIYGKKHVKYVRNITDVDDKINARAKKLGISIQKLTKETTQGFHEDMRYLYCLSPNIEPRATEHIQDMISIIETLLKQGNAYISNNHVYFDVTSYKDYNALSGRKLDEMIAGVRIEVEESKKHPQDFVLWKPADADDDPSSIFDSPFGKGRPGWHIECSAMSYKHLGKNFDIHGGGADLIFPHHTNEIAQSCCAFPESSFASTWVHNGFLTINGEKMSKSLGNFLTVKDVWHANNGTPGEVLRLALLSTNYRKPLDFNNKGLADAAATLDYFYRIIGNSIEEAEVPEEFLNILYDDINIPEAMSWLRNKAKEAHVNNDTKIKAAVRACGQLIGLFNSSENDWFKLQKSSFGNISVNDIEQAIENRNLARLNKNFAESDRIREELLARGIILEDTSGSTTWRRS